MKVKDFIPAYKEFKLKTCKRSSVSAYMLTIKNIILPILGDYDLEAVGSKEAESLKQDCENKGLSKKTIQDVIICLKNILKVANILEVKRGPYASWECGNDIIPLKKLFLLANHYKVSIDYILNLSNDNIKNFTNNELDISIVSKNLKKIRNTLKMSQYKIAESIDINQSTWWAYENGKTLITTINLTTLCKKFNLSTYRILNNNNQ